MVEKSDKKTHAWGIAGLILGIMSILLFLAPYIGIVLAIMAVVFYGIQRKHEPTGAATGGLVTGIIGIVINSIMLLFVIGALIFMSAVESSSQDTIIKPTSNVDNEFQSYHNENTQEVVNEDSKKIKSATISIDKVQIQVANLYPTRVTIENTGDVTISPKFDLYVYDENNNEVCSGSPMFDELGTISAGEKKTGEISIVGCMFEEDGFYSLQVDLLDNKYNKLDSASEYFNVDYWSKFS